MDVSTSDQLRRNLGPSWGFAFLQNAERWLPRPIFRTGVAGGAWIALACMPVQRRHARDYLRVVLGRPPRLVDIWRQFQAFTHFLLLKLRVARGVPHQGDFDPAHTGDFQTLIASGEPAFFGSFHFGRSDLLGFLLGGNFQRPVYMIRMKMGNSTDTRLLSRLFGKWVTFIWVNQPEDLLFALKEAVGTGGSLAMQCDRLEFTAKTEPFQFLGHPRLFPFTIYHLALVFDRPVIFCFGLPGASENSTVVHASTVFRKDHSLGHKANLARARVHFQWVVSHLETLVRQYPALWFNFLPLNPVVPTGSMLPLPPE